MLNETQMNSTTQANNMTKSNLIQNENILNSQKDDVEARKFVICFLVLIVMIFTFRLIKFFLRRSRFRSSLFLYLVFVNIFYLGFTMFLIFMAFLGSIHRFVFIGNLIFLLDLFFSTLVLMWKFPILARNRLGWVVGSVIGLTIYIYSRIWYNNPKSVVLPLLGYTIGLIYNAYKPNFLNLNSLDIDTLS